MNEIKGKTILLLGYGREGQSAHRYLAAQRKGLTIAIADRQNVRVQVSPLVSRVPRVKARPQV